MVYSEDTYGFSKCKTVFLDDVLEWFSIELLLRINIFYLIETEC